VVKNSLAADSSYLPGPQEQSGEQDHVLHGSGVVAGSRAGRSVIYRLTERGEHLATLLE
jgi:hypothetical protein